MNLRNIGLAIVFSVLLHALVLLLPGFGIQPAIAFLPPLTAKLMPLPASLLPTLEPKSVRQSKPSKPSRQSKPSRPSEPESEPVIVENTLASVSVEDQAPQPPMEQAAPEAMEEKPVHPLPKHAQLTFIAYKGTDLEIGEARHSLEITADKSYSLKVGMNTTGLASVFKTFELSQQSTGILTASGLQPGKYSESKITAKGLEALESVFDWEQKLLTLANGSQAVLPELAQDSVSFIYQFSQLALQQGELTMYISNGKKLERYLIAVGVAEMIETRLGTLRALPLRKVHMPGVEGLNIWLGLDYRLLPVKISQIDRDGKIAGEMVISQIRVADE